MTTSTASVAPLAAHGVPSPDPARTPFRAVACADGLSRCPWALGTPGTLADHDHAWGRRPSTGTEYFGALCLELLDAGLARWSQTGRHASWPAHMDGLDPARVARYTEDDVEELLLNPDLIRNRAKIEAVVHNAGVCATWTVERWRELLSAAAVPEPGPAPACSLDLHDVTAASRRLSAHLKSLGVVLVGPVTAQRWLQRTGHAASHVAGCHRHVPSD